MTMSKDLFLSILSMDAYNRGYNPGIANLSGTSIGHASILPVPLPDGSVPASFDGLAYKLTGSVGTSGNLIAAGKTIFACRGTDHPAQGGCQPTAPPDATPNPPTPPDTPGASPPPRGEGMGVGGSQLCALAPLPLPPPRRGREAPGRLGAVPYEHWPQWAKHLGRRCSTDIRNDDAKPPPVTSLLFRLKRLTPRAYDIWNGVPSRSRAFN